MKKFIERSRRAKKQGQSLIEYGLILGLVAVIAIAALQVMGDKINTAAETAGNSVESAATNSGKAYCDSLGSDFEWDDTAKVCKRKAAGS